MNTGELDYVSGRWIFKTALQSRGKRKIYRRVFTFYTNILIWSFHVLVVYGTTKKCTNRYNERAESLFCKLALLFWDVLVIRLRRVCWRSIKRQKKRENRSYSPVNVPRNEIKSVDNMYVKRCDMKCLFRRLVGKKFATNRYQSISIKLTIAIENRWQSIKGHKDLLHRLVIDYQYQSINWHRLISIVIDYRFWSIGYPGLLKKPLFHKPRWSCYFRPRKTLAAQKHRAISRQEKMAFSFSRRVALGLPPPLPPPPEALRTDGRMLTSKSKFVAIRPNFSTHGAPLCGLRCKGAPLSWKTWHKRISGKTNHSGRTTAGRWSSS